MAKKKTFITDNPALAFIDPPKEAEKTPPEQRFSGGMGNTSNARKKKLENRANNIEELRKIITPELEEQLKAELLERKTRRVQLLFKESLYNSIKEKADRQGISVNKYINQLCEKALEEE